MCFRLPFRIYSNQNILLKGKLIVKIFFYSILEIKKIKHNVVFDAKVRTFKSETDIKSF